MTGYAFATALAAPVEDGIMLAEAARHARQSLPFIELSTTICEAVAAWTVVMRPCLIPNFSLMTFTSGARPLVVHEAQETTFISVLYSSALTPTTMVGVSASLAGAEIITFFAPPSTCFMQPSVVVKAPVDSQTYSTPVLLQGISVGSRVAERVIGRPLTLRPLSISSTVPSNRPWTVSCSSKYFMYSGDIGELMCLRTKSSRSIAMRATWRPMRPKPLMPSLIGASGLVDLATAEPLCCADCHGNDHLLDLLLGIAAPGPRNADAGTPRATGGDLAAPAKFEVGMAIRLSAALVSLSARGKTDKATTPPTRRPTPALIAMPALKLNCVPLAR